MPSAVDHTLITLVGSLNAVVTEPDRWPAVLDRLREAFAAAACAIASHHYDTGTGRLVRSVGIADGFVARYAEGEAAGNPWLRKEPCFRKPGTALVGRQIVPDAEALRSDYWLRWLKPQGLGPQMFGVLDRQGDTVVYLVLARAAGRDPFAADDAVRLSAVLPAFASVFRLEHLIRTLTARAADTWTLLDHLAPGIVLVDDRSRIIGMNRTAAEIARTGNGLAIDRGHLTASLPREQARLREIVGELSGSDPTRPGAHTKAVSIGRSGDGAPLQAIFTRVSDPTVASDRKRALVGVFLSDPDRLVAPCAEWIRDLYGLTRVESEIALLLCRGHSPDEIATRVSVSVHTVRAYLKQIFLKLGVNRQAAMVGRLIGGPGQLRVNRAAAAGDHRPRASLRRRTSADPSPFAGDDAAFSRKS